MLPHPTDRPGRRHPSPYRILRTLAVAAGCGFAWLHAAAADGLPPSAASAPAGPAVSDVALARAALAALDSDPVFRDVNLLVSVVDRVAVVGGPVPSPDVGRRAERLIRDRVPGIAEVKNRCFVQAGPDPFLLALSGRAAPAPRRPLVAELPGVVPSPKTGLVEESALPPDTARAAAEPREQVVVARRPANPNDNILLPPVGASGRAGPAAPPALPPAVLTSVPPTPPADVLTAAAAAARRADRRFAGLTVDLRDGTLVVAGTAARTADAWDLARELRRIPGVARVAVGAVDVR